MRIFKFLYYVHVPFVYAGKCRDDVHIVSTETLASRNPK